MDKQKGSFTIDNTVEPQLFRIPQFLETRDNSK